MRGVEPKNWAADAHDAGWRGVLSKKTRQLMLAGWRGVLSQKSWAADAHDAGWRGVLSQKGGQLMLMMLAGMVCLAKKLGS